jgi:hypothetical protein
MRGYTVDTGCTTDGRTKQTAETEAPFYRCRSPSSGRSAATFSLWEKDARRRCGEPPEKLLDLHAHRSAKAGISGGQDGALILQALLGHALRRPDIAWTLTSYFPVPGRGPRVAPTPITTGLGRKGRI